ncbi:E3 ubiquitin-protein ligase PDZRN3-like [Amphibalanus amphitrite]|uniref:E3 ubiquitin-protein ligase PDZRN3-like n=1 Tax=Amphibalanus amphitrite TaxID=1232801 RepID=UPI001C926879|nr:E3 ubiquitin-protein ligase PDZRN3-like [Amphibalanus amphitrite]
MDFIILKVNGQDVSRASHEEAVRAFQAAREPIVVEVLRRPSAADAVRSDANLNPRQESDDGTEAVGVTAATQTVSWPEFPPPPPFEDDLHDEDDPCFDEEGDPQLDFQEVTLNRSLTSDLLGLTLFYPDGDEADEETDVLVQDIEPGGIAETDGRIQPGDQIVQINGEDVCSKEQAERLLSSQPTVTLLVCRPWEQDDDGCHRNRADAEEINHSSPEYVEPPLDNRAVDTLSGDIGPERDSQEKRDTMRSSSTNSSSSSVSSASSGSVKSCSSQTDRQRRGDLSVDSEMRSVHSQMALIQRECESLARRQRAARRRIIEDHIYETIPEDGESDEPLYCQPFEPRAPREAPGDSKSPPEPPSGRPVNHLPGWMRTAEPWTRRSSTSDSRSSGDSRPGEKRREAGRQPVALELTVLGSEKRESALTLPTRESAPRASRSGESKEDRCKRCRHCSRTTKNKNDINSANTAEKNRNYVTILPQGTSYTSAAKLEETIHQQQRQLYQQLMRRTQERAPNSSQQPANSPFTGSLRQYRFVSSPGGGQQNHNLTLPANRGQDEQPQYQYRVKVRSDGSRYIARRPMRSQLLKERAARIAEERTGITTDDDAMSELKLGKYWPKEEKKRQLEHAKEKKLKLQQRLKMTSVQEEGTQDELSLRKRQVLPPGMSPSLSKKPPPTPSRRRPHHDTGVRQGPPLGSGVRQGPPRGTADLLLSVTTV